MRGPKKPSNMSLVALAGALVSAAAAPPPTLGVDVFTDGESGYKAFRIPGVVAAKGAVVVFAEGRKVCVHACAIYLCLVHAATWGTGQHAICVLVYAWQALYVPDEFPLIAKRQLACDEHRSRSCVSS